VIVLRVTEYLMMRRSGGCGHATTAPAPPRVRGGRACYGPNVEAAATLLASADVIGVERAADLMSTLLGAPVSTGFVSACLVRLDAALLAAGFEEALKDALKAADVLGTGESPAPLTAEATAATRTCTRCAPCALTPAAGRTWSGCRAPRPLRLLGVDWRRGKRGCRLLRLAAV